MEEATSSFEIPLANIDKYSDSDNLYVEFSLYTNVSNISDIIEYAKEINETPRDLFVESGSPNLLNFNSNLLLLKPKMVCLFLIQN